MAQVKLLKISNGLPTEMDSAADDVTLSSYSVTGGGPVLSGTGLDMNNQDVSDIQDLVFVDPTTGTINQTAGSLIIDDFMAKDRANVMQSGSDILFGSVTDVAGEVDAFRLPRLAGVPSATPAASADPGYLVYDSSNDDLYVWDGAAWKNLENSEAVENFWTAGEILAAAEAVYISAADTVSLADASVDAESRPIGFASTGAAAAASVPVVTDGIASGFSGLTAGDRMYLDTTPGAITSTPPGAGNNVIQVGIAKSATEVQIQIQFMGKKAA